MSVPFPNIIPFGTPNLRLSYESRKFAFSDGVGPDHKTVVLIGSCRVVPYLNYLRVYNAMCRKSDRLHLICLNPVEMWGGIGHDVVDGVNETLRDFRFGRVDWLVCEHVQYCGALNTVRSSEQNIYDCLGCAPEAEIRLPNWNQMHIFDLETEQWDVNRTGYALMEPEQRVVYLKGQTRKHKTKFILHCSSSTFPDFGDWVDSNWLDIRMGWTSNHPTLAIFSRLFMRIVERMGLDAGCGFLSHPLLHQDTYASTGIQLTAVDRQANQWRF